MSAQTNISSDTFAIGGDLIVNRMGYGAMRLTDQPANFGPYPDWEQGKALLRRAAELGVNFFDTARAYGPQWNEKLLGEALEGLPDIVFATKGGIDKLSPTEMVKDASPALLRQQIDDALVNLRVNQIGLFQLHWVDPNTPIEVSIEALAKAQADGKIRHIGVSNVTVEELRAAQSVAAIASVQNRYNVLERDQDAMIDLTASEGIAFVPYGPLGAHPMQKGSPLAAHAGQGTSTGAQSALRALLDRSPNMVVIPGTTSIKHLEENMGA
ncbi:aldo/keto reductase [Jannaschia sp. CCS1]|uniref:aldo/keto reductase n=1 Tax=Jannaschia sp. (strain CCS1) TaxID=290400 RepID=UPI000053B806|nr:aldo/keto reductase [Jannaschia sp. CCS1]ABD53806.1 aldo/keto reductase [Jannaschia sp. CCS1]